MQRTRVNAKGYTVPSNHGVRRLGPSLLACEGCGREFNAYDLTGRTRDLAPWNGADPRVALNEARARNHADRCKAPTA